MCVCVCVCVCVLVCVYVCVDSMDCDELSFLKSSVTSKYVAS